MSDVSTVTLDRETTVCLTLDQLVRDLRAYTGDMYYQVQDASLVNALTPDEYKKMCDWVDRMTYFYKQCLQMQDILSKRTLVTEG